MDDENGESTEPMEEMPFMGLGEPELEISNGEKPPGVDRDMSERYAAENSMCRRRVR